jgi:GGDEF domain-containing protein
MTLEQEVVHWKNMVRMYKFDHLTGLKQRHDFEVETMHKMTKQKFYLAMVDVVGLHAINREKGYAAGDALIKQVGYDLQQTEGSWEVYRIGGDEFMALFFDKPKDLDIENATCAYINSDKFEYFTDMVSTVDQMVTDKKNKLKRRRAD